MVISLLLPVKEQVACSQYRIFLTSWDLLFNMPPLRTVQPITRRKFITGSAAATGAVLINPYLSACSQFHPDMKTGYFEKEFGIDHSLCHRLLETALSRGGDFADLYFEHTLSNSLGLEDGKVNRASGLLK